MNLADLGIAAGADRESSSELVRISSLLAEEDNWQIPVARWNEVMGELFSEEEGLPPTPPNATDAATLVLPHVLSPPASPAGTPLSPAATEVVPR